MSGQAYVLVAARDAGAAVVVYSIDSVSPGANDSYQELNRTVVSFPRATTSPPEETLMSSSHPMPQNPAEERLAMLGARLVSLAKLLKLISEHKDNHIDRQTVMAAVSAFAQKGAGHQTAIHRQQFISGTMPPDQATQLLEDALAAIEQSPLPEHEWAPVTELLGDELLEDLLGTSASSMRGYRTGYPPTPVHIAQRLHFISLIVADLAGSWNSNGMRHWFGRCRSALSGQSPAEILAGNWAPDDPGALAVKSLAAVPMHRL